MWLSYKNTETLEGVWLYLNNIYIMLIIFWRSVSWGATRKIASEKIEGVPHQRQPRPSLFSFFFRAALQLTQRVEETSFRAWSSSMAAIFHPGHAQN